MNDIQFLNLFEIAKRIESGVISSESLTRFMLERIYNVDKRLHSYITIMPKYALKKAQMADREIASGNYRGHLHGIPIAVKDLIYSKNAPTTGGHSFLENFIPEYDATVIRKLDDAGAVLLGKLNLAEGGMAGYHKDFEIPINPWGESYWAGISSSGSGVATAAGLCFASLATDTGGSIRFPSMANGVVGFKPSFGRVSRYGILPLSKSFDQVGFMTRCTKDAAIMLEATAGYDANDPTTIRKPITNIEELLNKDIQGFRIGVDEDYIREGVDDEVGQSILLAIKQLETQGGEIIKFKIPWDKGKLASIWSVICSKEAVEAHFLNYPAKTEQYGLYFQDFLSFGASVSEKEYWAAHKERLKFKEQFLKLFNSMDVIVCPSGTLPDGITHEVQYGNMKGLIPYLAALNMHFTMPANFAGTPTLTLPCGVTSSGFPISMQLIGKPMGELFLCSLGHSFEKNTIWNTQYPNV